MAIHRPYGKQDEKFPQRGWFGFLRSWYLRFMNHSVIARPLLRREAKRARTRRLHEQSTNPARIRIKKERAEMAMNEREFAQAGGRIRWWTRSARVESE